MKTVKRKTLVFFVLACLLAELTFAKQKSNQKRKKTHHKKSLQSRRKKSKHHQLKRHAKTKKHHSKSKHKHKTRAERLAMLTHIMNSQSDKPKRQLSGSGGGLSMGPVSVKFMPPPTPNNAPITINIPKLKHVFKLPDPNKEQPIILGKQMLFSPKDHRTQVYRNKRHTSSHSKFYGLQNPYHGMIAPSSSYPMHPEMSYAYQKFAANPGLSSGAAALAEGMSPFQTPMWKKRNLI